MTYNILADAWTSSKHYPDLDPSFLKFESRIKRIITTIQAVSPDIIHIQELDVLSLQKIKSELENDYIIEVSWHSDELWDSWLEEKEKRHHGNAILMRRNWKEIVGIDRIKTSDEGNFAIIAEMEHAVFINAHLEYLPNETRAKQMKILFEKAMLHKAVSKPVIWAGDFNVLQEDLVEMSENGFHSTPASYPTCFYDSPKTIDHIYSTNVQLKILERPSEVTSMETCLTEYGSDHVPVIAIISLTQ